MKPRDPNSLMSRIERFFTDNPDEWLSMEDLAIKFNCTRRQATTAFQNLQNHGRMKLKMFWCVKLADHPKDDR